MPPASTCRSCRCCNHRGDVVPDAAFCAVYNSNVAEFVDQAPDRLRAFAMLDMSDVPSAVDELRRAVGELGLLAGGQGGVGSGGDPAPVGPHLSPWR